MEEPIQKLKEMVEASEKIVFFGGAGCSTESGIKDFRSRDGLYHQSYEYPPEEILSHDFFRRRPEVFYSFYREKLLAPKAKPNAAHRKLAELERQGKLLAVITQNVDGLHQAAGSKRVLELHGSVYRNYCERCGRQYPGLERILGTDGVPCCDCGGRIRPDVVLYQERLDEEVLAQAVEAISQADMLIIGGTSLAVYPAAGLVRYFRGSRLVVINRDPVPMDAEAALVIRKPIGETLACL